MQQERYRLGTSTIVDLLTSQAALNQAQANLVQARYNYLVARAQIEALVGHAPVSVAVAAAPRAAAARPAGRRRRHPHGGAGAGLRDRRRGRARAARRGPRGPPQRVRRRHGAVGVGQVHPDEPHRLPRHADRRRVLAQRPARLRPARTTSWRTSATGRSGSSSRPSTCCRAPRALHNVELPLIYGGVRARRAAGAGRRGARGGRPRRPQGPPPQRAVGRPAPARRGGPRAGHQPHHPPRRRADGEPRLGDGRGDHAPARDALRTRARPSSWSRTNTTSQPTRDARSTSRTG